MLYNAAEILSVKNSKLNITYEEGIDYTYANGKITLTKNSRIHTFQYGDIYFNSGHDNNRWALKSGLGYKYTLFYEGTYFHENQIAVTYLHSEPWTGFKPDYEGDNLPNVINKLKKRRKCEDCLLWRQHYQRRQCVRYVWGSAEYANMGRNGYTAAETGVSKGKYYDV